MSLSAALREAMASGHDDAVIAWTAEIDHATFPEPVYIVNGIEGDVTQEPELRRVYLPITAGGPDVAHIPAAFALIPPGHDSDGPTDAKLSVDLISGQLEPMLRSAIGYNSAISVTFRAYLITDDNLTTIDGPDEELEGLELRNVSLKETSAEGIIAWPDGRQVNTPTGPHSTFTREEYPGLF